MGRFAIAVSRAALLALFPCCASAGWSALEGKWTPPSSYDSPPAGLNETGGNPPSAVGVGAAAASAASLQSSEPATELGLRLQDLLFGAFLVCAAGILVAFSFAFGHKVNEFLGRYLKRDADKNTPASEVHGSAAPLLGGQASSCEGKGGDGAPQISLLDLNCNRWAEHLRKKAKKLNDFEHFLALLPEMQKCFDFDTGLPIVQISVELESILEINLEDDYANIQYGILLDWYDVVPKDVYTKSRDAGKGYWGKSSNYFFQPAFDLLYQLDSEHGIVDSSRNGTRYDKRIPLSTPSKTPKEEKGKVKATEEKRSGDYVLIKFKKTMKAFTKVKQSFSLRNFPLDFHLLKLSFEPKKVNTKSNGFKTSLMRKKGKWSSTSNAPTLLFRFSTQPLRVKALKSFEEEKCKVSSLLSQTATYPFMSHRAANFRDFFFDTRIDDGHRSKPPIAPEEPGFFYRNQPEPHHESVDLYQINVHMHRKSGFFIIHNLAPVVIIIMLTPFANWCDGVGDKLGFLTTLLLTLYAHKYVMVQQLNTMTTTRVEDLVMFATGAIFVQCCLVILESEKGKGYFKGGSPISAEMLIIGSVLVLVIWFGIESYRFYRNQRRAEHLSQTLVPSWLYKYAPKATKVAMKRHSAGYQSLISEITLLEKGMIESGLARIMTFPYHPLQDPKGTHEEMANPSREGVVDDRIASAIDSMIRKLLDNDEHRNLLDNFHKSKAGRLTHVKDQMECYIKHRVRCKAVNDRYRCQFLYEQTREANKLVDAIVAAKWKVVKLDANLTDVSRPLFFRLHLLFDQSDGLGEPIPCELMLMNTKSKALMQEKMVHDIYKVTRLSGLIEGSWEHQEMLHILKEARNGYSLCNSTMQDV